jgi:hypothetical protein
MNKTEQEKQKALDQVNPTAEMISKLKQEEKKTGKNFSAAIDELQRKLNDLLKGRG